MTHLLHINDNNLLVQQSIESGGKIIQRSRGYAWLKDSEVLFDLNSDSAPIKQVHLKPQEINTRYWQQCAENAIPANGAGMRHAADLIWRHLAELKTASQLEAVALVVPAHYQDSHLRLMLGVAKANDLDVAALFAKPVLSVRQHAQVLGKYLHVDVQLHQTVISTVDVTTNSVELTNVETKSELSLNYLQDALLQNLQQRFIQNDRFDPLHDAETEQQLFDQLSELVSAALEQEKAPVGVQSKGRLYNSVLESNDVAQAFTELSRLLSQYANHNIVVDMNNGFELSKLDVLNNEHLIWASKPSALHAVELDSKNDSGEVIYRSSVPNINSKIDGAAEPKFQQAKAKESSPATPMLSQAVGSVTHLLQFGHAVPIENANVGTGDSMLKLSRAANNASDIHAMIKAGQLEIVNDSVRKTLKPNDRLMSPVADGVITAISVL